MATTTLFVLLERLPDSAETLRVLSGMAKVDPLPRESHGAAYAWSAELATLPDATVMIEGIARPYTETPDALERAKVHAYAWNGAEDAASRHRAQLRAQVIYGGDPALAPPPKRRLDAEIMTTTDVVRALSDLPGALAYFDPDGEVLLGLDRLQSSILLSRASSIPPFDLWSNVRMFRGNEGWMMMDTVGLGQLGMSDHEAWFPLARCPANDIALWLRNLSSLSLRGTVFDDGTRASGPGDMIFEARRVAPSQAPGRRILRWLPEGMRPPSLSHCGMQRPSMQISPAAHTVVPLHG